jgi:hypothetical protein
MVRFSQREENELLLVSYRDPRAKGKELDWIAWNRYRSWMLAWMCASIYPTFFLDCGLTSPLVILIHHHLSHDAAPAYSWIIWFHSVFYLGLGF